MGKSIFTAGQAQQQTSQPTTARLIVTPEARAGRFTGRLQRTGELVVSNSRQPLVDAARRLLELGFDPATPLTMRLIGKAHDSFNPLPIGQWAKWTYSEGEEHPLKRRVWVPREVPVAADREGQKSTSKAVPGLRPGRAAEIALPRRGRGPMPASRRLSEKNHQSLREA
jgi:hypothetical protein